MRSLSLLLLMIFALSSGCAGLSANPDEAVGGNMPVDETERRSVVLTASAYIQASYEAVWTRFTSAAAYEAWYSAPCLEFGSEPGSRVAWGRAGQPVYHGTLEKIEKGQGLTHTFQFVGFGFEEPPTPVDIEILERGETVLVTIRHDCSGAPRTAEMISPVGWLKSLSRLKTLLETGRAMEWPGDPPADGQ